MRGCNEQIALKPGWPDKQPLDLSGLPRVSSRSLYASGQSACRRFTSPLSKHTTIGSYKVQPPNRFSASTGILISFTIHRGFEPRFDEFRKATLEGKTKNPLFYPQRVPPRPFSTPVFNSLECFNRARVRSRLPPLSYSVLNIF